MPVLSGKKSSSRKAEHKANQQYQQVLPGAAGTIKYGYPRRKATFLLSFFLITSAFSLNPHYIVDDTDFSVSNPLAHSAPPATDRQPPHLMNAHHFVSITVRI
jgi:hypothetical protein